ncbi:MAG: class I SAM-dependent methyltransferase [Candidatus Dormibacteraeota bacterium]|nr:class I SAM-dependent methyltransferase [Candidatus Dormibacteraeota bacterium]
MRVPGRRTLKRLLNGSAGNTIALDYPTSALNAPRYGYGRASHTQLLQLLEQATPRFAEELGSLWTFRPDLERISVAAEPGELPYWDNAWTSGLDGVALYGYVRLRRPRRYIEVGSGFSTRFVAQAIRDGGLDTTITSIDPAPREGVDTLCETVIRAPLELAGTDWVTELQAGDIVFFDGSHRAFMNSDVTIFFLEILPLIPSGVLVGIDDIWWPDDYPQEWADRFYSEQYLLAAYLVAGCTWLRPRLAARYVDMDPGLRSIGADFWDRPGMETASRTRLGLTFWMDVDRG